MGAEPPINPPEPRCDATCRDCGEDFLSEDHEPSDAMREIIGDDADQVCNACRAIDLNHRLSRGEVDALTEELTHDRIGILQAMHRDQLRDLHTRIRKLQEGRQHAQENQDA